MRSSTATLVPHDPKPNLTSSRPPLPPKNTHRYTSTWHYFERLPSLSGPGIGTGPTPAWAWDFDVTARRENLIAFVGIIRKMAPSATQLRRALVKQCKLANEKHGIEKAENFDALCSLRVLDKHSWKNFGDEASLYRQTTFCLLPTGDIPSRKAVFDMLIAGCIPVVFDSRQIDLYRWHLSADEIAAIHVLVGNISKIYAKSRT